MLPVAGGAWYASLRVPTGPAAGIEVRGRFVNGAAESGTIRVGTFNIHGCKGRDRRRDVDRVAECLRGLNFAALSEVRSNRFWRPQDQAEMLAGRLRRAWLFAPASRRAVFFGPGGTQCRPAGMANQSAKRLEWTEV